MKWPQSVTLIRHDESAYNAHKASRAENPNYQKFRKLFDSNPEDPECTKLARTLANAYAITVGDHNTPLAPGAGFQAEKMADNLKNTIPLPDIIFVSPYERTLHTLQHMFKTWPELRKIKTVEEGRIREQEHGLLNLYGDWRIYQALYPEQRKLHQLEGRYYYRFPQGESVEDVRERTRSWFNTLVRDFSGKNVLAITHHLTILAVRANMERLDAQQFLDLDTNNTPINAGVTIYRGHPELGKDGKLILDNYNLKMY